ncbi:MAG TPA: hypothetical protein VG797_03465 [Phycisphaerales bacterium]|nr:hypothetical protein [Phycisphaerales bacterium]
MFGRKFSLTRRGSFAIAVASAALATVAATSTTALGAPAFGVTIGAQSRTPVRGGGVAVSVQIGRPVASCPPPVVQACGSRWEYHGTARIRDHRGNRREVPICGGVIARNSFDARRAARCEIEREAVCRYPGARIRGVSLSVWRSRH